MLPHFSVHNLRHTFCTRMCENEPNVKVIQEIMGHRDISTTMDVYNEATKNKKMESFARMDGKMIIARTDSTPSFTPTNGADTRGYGRLRTADCRKALTLKGSKEL